MNARPVQQLIEQFPMGSVFARKVLMKTKTKNAKHAKGSLWTDVLIALPPRLANNAMQKKDGN